ncbi:MAG: glycosyltransferase family 2 protein [Acidovorax sp.]|uniref:glycosyltransferase family 2 protein n=1 Tax=Acidovorax sp. TaxID=1872122 RepID=UPI0025C391A5|nr:glycosyltransferase family A protein [Acidovorax sp.]MCE1194649.1 glycosyltransferase family 2 protein [Acidovorax sp.]
MHVTGIMVTLPSRLKMAQLAIADFCRQSHPERELLIAHDGDNAFDDLLRRWVTHAPPCTETATRIAVHQLAAGQTLGALRNQAVKLARGDLVCQWDDDDRCHPLRIALQLEALQKANADFCFLSDQLHGFPQERTLVWDDWNDEAYPLNFVQGTLLGKREKMPAYPEVPRGEDTGLCLAILAAGHAITRLRHCGWCYIYTFHGGNVWDARHHQAISELKQMPLAFVTTKKAELRARIGEYIDLAPYAQIRASGMLVPLQIP